ncbi:protein canopy-1-like [Diretmus argenteus]
MEETRRKHEVKLLTQRVPCGVPLARSETHLSELLDGVCDSMSDYALHVDPDTQDKRYMRFAPRSSGAAADFPDFKNFQFDGPDASNALKFACESVVEELEDEFISLFSQDAENELDHAAFQNVGDSAFPLGKQMEQPFK